jgi:hypothetical protein
MSSIGEKAAEISMPACSIRWTVAMWVLAVIEDVQSAPPQAGVAVLNSWHSRTGCNFGEGQGFQLVARGFEQPRSNQLEE